MIVWIAGILLREYLWQIVMAIVTAIFSLLLVFLWAISIIYNPAGGGIYWLASQSQPNQTLQLGAPTSSGGTTTINPSTIPLPVLNPGVPPVLAAGFVTDAERYQLIAAAGAPPAVAIIMTAISIAEDGSGNPAIISPLNTNKTVDIGLWQDNSAHIGSCGITSIAYLQDPMNNARAAMCILGPSLNYCAWSTYGTYATCGILGHTNSYAAFLPCAEAISEGATCKR